MELKPCIAVFGSAPIIQILSAYLTFFDSEKLEFVSTGLCEATVTVIQ